MILKDGKRRIAIVSLDLLYIGGQIRDQLLKDLSSEFQESELFISATHNHYAPSTDPTKPLLGKSNPNYIRFVADTVSDLLRKIAAGPYSRGSIVYKVKTGPDLTINRRGIGWSRAIPPRYGMSNIPNPKGLKDDKIRMIELLNESEEPEAILWGYCCHPTGYPEPNTITAHYPGAIRRALRKTYGQDMAIVFLQGFSGNVNPAVFSKRPAKILSKNAVEYAIFSLLNERDFGLFTKSEWDCWISKLGSSVVDLSMDSTCMSLDCRLSVLRGTTSLSSIGFGGGGSHQSIHSLYVDMLRRITGSSNLPEHVHPNHNLSIHVICIDTLKIVGISAEPVSEYVPVVARMLNNHPFIPVGYIDDVFGYLPTEAMIAEGGYDVEGFIPYFGLRGSYKSGFQQEIEEVLKSLINQ